MYRVQFNDLKRLSSFLSVNDVDYVDVLFSGNRMRMITNTTDAYTEYSVPAKASEGQGDLECRIYKKLLQFVSANDRLEIADDGSGKIHVSFFDDVDVLHYKSSFNKQVVASVAYCDKMSLVENLPLLDRFNTDTLNSIYRIAKMSTGVVTVDNGIASVLLKEGPRVYCKVGILAPFSFITRSYEYLRKCSKFISSYNDVLVAKDETFYVVTKKARMQPNDEFTLLMEKKFGANYTAEIDLSNLARFLIKTKLTVDAVDVDVESQTALLEAMRSQFKVPVRLTNVQTTGKLKTLSIPTIVMIKIILNLKQYKFKLRVTRNFTQLKADDVIVIW